MKTRIFLFTVVLLFIAGSVWAQFEKECDKICENSSKPTCHNCCTMELKYEKDTVCGPNWENCANSWNPLKHGDFDEFLNGCFKEYDDCINKKIKMIGYCFE